MPALAAPRRLSRATSVRLHLPPEAGGEVVVIPPVSLDQAAECLALDPDPDGPRETDAARTERLRQQAKVLLGPAHAHLTGKLSAGQIEEVTEQLYAAACGIAPEDWLKVKAGLIEFGQVRSAIVLAAELDALSVALAADLKRFPSEVGAMPMADACSLHAALLKNAAAELKTQAALHDKEVR